LGIGYWVLGIGLLDCGMRISDCGLKKPVFGVRQWNAEKWVSVNLILADMMVAAE